MEEWDGLTTEFVRGGGKKGGDVVFRDNFKFVFHKQLVCGELRWTCAVKSCKAYLRTINREVVSSFENHTHSADEKEKQIVHLRVAVKRKAEDDICTPPRKIVRKVLRELPDSDVTLRQVANLRKISYRAKRKKNPCKLPRSREDVFQCLRIMNTRTEKNEELLLYEDEMCGIIIFSTPSNLRCLVDSKSVYMDGTFSYCTKFFVQLFTVHGYINGIYIPLVFCLLPSKEKIIYEKCLQAIMDKCQEIVEATFQPEICIVDFEKSVHQAVSVVWPHTTLVGCRFHLRQSWYREIQSLGLSKDYKDDTQIGQWLHWAFGLPYCNPAEVGDAFCSWVLDKPDIATCQVFLEYLHDTYVADDSTFPPTLWASKTADVNRTTNACESFHSTFNKDFYTPHPDIFTFFDELLSIQADVYPKLNSIGEPNLPRPAIQNQIEWVNKWIEKHNKNEVTLYKFVRVVSYKLSPYF